MILVIICWIAAAAVVIYTVRHNMKRDDNPDEKRTMDLIRLSRTMFPTAENEIVALEQLHQHLYRELLNHRDDESGLTDELHRDCILVHNAKLRAINDAVQFEAQYHLPVIKKDYTTVILN